MMVIRAGIHKMLVRKANRETHQTASEEAESSLMWLCPVCLGFFARNFRTFNYHIRKIIFIYPAGQDYP